MPRKYFSHKPHWYYIRRGICVACGKKFEEWEKRKGKRPIGKKFQGGIIPLGTKCPECRDSTENGAPTVD